MLVQEFIVPFKRRLFLMLMFIMLVTVMFCRYVEYKDIKTLNFVIIVKALIT